MADLFLTEHGSSLSLEGENINIFFEGKKVMEVALNHLDSIQIYGYIQFSTQVLYKIMQSGVEMAFHTQDGKLVGQVTPPLSKNLNLRVNQHQIQNDFALKLALTKELIGAKFQNCISLVEEFGKNRDELNLSEELSNLRLWLGKIKEAEDLQEVLGLEGSFASLYYKSYQKLFQREGLFLGRSKRPPLDPANAVLSYSYTITTNRIGSFLDGLGYDPFLGIFHTMDYGRMSLACDLIESLRPCFCDWTVLKWFNLGIFSDKEDFEPQETGGIYLNKSGQRKFFPQFKKEWESNRLFLKARIPVGDILKLQHAWLRDSLNDKTAYPLNQYLPE